MRTRHLVPIVVAALAAGLLAPSPMAEPETGARPSVVATRSDFGRVLFDGSNRALYVFTRDPRGRSTCYGACAAAWPPAIVTGALGAGPGTQRSLLGTTRRRDGRRQLTYAGRPLYRYVGDPVGQVRCQNVREFGGLWLVVRPSGALIR